MKNMESFEDFNQNAETNHKEKEVIKLDPGVIQKKIDLINQGLPIDITEQEFLSLQDDLNGARGFSLDMIEQFQNARKTNGNQEAESALMKEEENLAEIEMALRELEKFKESHRQQIRRMV